ncbi:MAG TPA: VWA domain-containing protein [Candidatus Merdivicinus intestinavium]|nr:VWA domain-containing protein [Candidatus Merdivicinus intestinavium]
MTVIQWIVAGIGGAAALAGIVFLLIGIFRKKKLLTGKILPALLIAAGLIAAAVPLYQAWQQNRQIQRYNYAACRLMELSDYGEARSAAENAYSISPNGASAQLVLISLGYQERYSVAQDAAQKYLVKVGGTEIAELQNLCAEGDAGENIETGLSQALRRVEESLSLSQADKTAAEGIVNARHSIAIGEWSAELQQELAQLGSADDPFLLKTAAQLSSVQGDTGAAFSLMQEAVELDDSFPSRAVLAQMAAAGASSYSMESETDAELQRIWEEEERRQLELQELNAKLQAEENQRKILELQSQIAEKEEEIRSLSLQADQLPVRRAINYIKASRAEDLPAYSLTLASLYYRLGDTLTAEEYLVELFTRMEDYKDSGYLWSELRHVTEAYEASLTFDRNAEGVTEQQIANATPETAVSELLAAMGQSLVNVDVYPLTDSYSSGGEDEEAQQPVSFGTFLLDTLIELRSSVHIGAVDASNYPEITVQVSFAAEKEDGSDYTAEDMSLYRNGRQLSDFSLSAVNEENASDVNICMVVDHSGSMEGERLENAKSAVSSFILGMDSGTKVGLVAFDDQAEILSPVTESQGVVQRQVDALTADGGTYIGGGLKAAMEALSGVSGSRVIVLLSDGEDGGSPEEMDTIVSQLASQGIAVYAIGIASADSAYLNDICTRTGGAFIRAEESGNLASAYQTVGSFVSGSYLLRFTADEGEDPYHMLLRLVLDNGMYDQAEFDLGVTPEEIAAEDLLGPSSNFFQQTGGSRKGEIGDEDSEG